MRDFYLIIKFFEVSHEESVYISTDGITEAKINDEELDSKGLAQIAKKQHGQSAPQRYQQIKEYLKRDNVIVHDDATLLIILPKTE